MDLEDHSDRIPSRREIYKMYGEEGWEERYRRIQRCENKEEEIKKYMKMFRDGYINTIKEKRKRRRIKRSPIIKRYIRI